MGFHHQTLILIFTISLLSATLVSSHQVSFASAPNYTTYRNVSSSRLQRIHKYLSKINKQPVLTIESPDGDIIDCVHKAKQLALDHPLLKNHKIQEKPSTTPSMNMTNASRKDFESKPEAARQLWHTTGTRCPKGTIPIRRTTVDDVLLDESLFQFGKKRRRLSLQREVDAPNVIKGLEHQHAFVSTTASAIYGAEAAINLWNPQIQQGVDEFSLAQIWVLSGSDDTDLNSIEAGWQVYPSLYGGGNPRLFVYWTRDSYHSTGCYNLKCAGFVQTNNQIALGAALSTVSTYGGQQHDITFLIWKDQKDGNWWLRLDGTTIGYWPSKLFTRLVDHATLIEFGGEVTNQRAGGRHTSTQMGSGHFAEEGVGKAGYFRNLKVVDSSNTLTPLQRVQITAEAPGCYNIISSFDQKNWGAYFYYGGPGSNPNCP